MQKFKIVRRVIENRNVYTVIDIETLEAVANFKTEIGARAFCAGSLVEESKP